MDVPVSVSSVAAVEVLTSSPLSSVEGVLVAFVLDVLVWGDVEVAAVSDCGVVVAASPFGVELAVSVSCWSYSSLSSP